MVWQRRSRIDSWRSVLYLGWLCQLGQLLLRIESIWFVFRPRHHVGEGLAGAWQKRLHERLRARVVRLEGRRRPQVLWPQQRAECVERQEGESAGDGSSD